MKVTFKYSSSFVSGECIIETQDGKEMISFACDLDNIPDDAAETMSDRLRERESTRFLFHDADSIDIYYPAIKSSAEAFYSNMYSIEQGIRRELSNADDAIEVTTFDDPSRVFLDNQE
jgi:hypothetical protein